MADHRIDVVYTTNHTWIASIGSDTGEGPDIQSALDDLAMNRLAELMEENDTSMIAYETSPCEVYADEGKKIMSGFSFVNSRLLTYREVEVQLAHFWPMVWVDEEWIPEGALGLPIEVE